jgi:sugar/nucleoside kinase (ribokinase family)
MSKMDRIVAFGNPVYDEIVTPLVRTEGRVLSGCSTNACLALARLGHATALVGCVGDDRYEQLLGDLEGYGVLPLVARGPTSGGFRLVYDARGDRTLDVLGVAPPIEHIPEESAAARALIIGPILQETSLDFVERVCQSSAAPVFLDPQGLLRRIGAGGRIEHFAPPEFARVARRCLVVKANEVEAQVLTGIAPREDPAGAARALRELGCAIAIVTLAEEGSFIDSGTEQWSIPAYATDVRDPTGAGDTYLAGFLHAYLEDPSDLYRAGCSGAATASIWIEHTGPDAPVASAEVAFRTQALLAQRPSHGGSA